MKTYLNIVDEVLTTGDWKENRTGTRALTIAGAMLRHDMSLGFPLLSTKKMPFKSIKVELEFFIKGLTDKSWLKERGCSIWNEWCSPDKVPPNLGDDERKKFQLGENDLGPIYGAQWRGFGDGEQKVDQLARVIKTLKENPNDRRMIVSAWNPLALQHMALPPCHVLFHLVGIGEKLNLTWFQRSCDLMLGIPFNVASYALLLHLLCLESGMTPGCVTGMLSDVHIYEDHIEGAKEQLKREPLPLAKINTEGFKDIFSWEYTQTSILDYASHEKINFPIAV